MSRDDSDVRGHYRSAGAAIGFVGGMALVAAGVATFVMPQDMGFIDLPTMTLVSVLFLGIAAWMISWKPSTPSW